jgi:hypothetical protein
MASLADTGGQPAQTSGKLFRDGRGPIETGEKPFPRNV